MKSTRGRESIVAQVDGTYLRLSRARDGELGVVTGDKFASVGAMLDALGRYTQVRPTAVLVAIDGHTDETGLHLPGFDAAVPSGALRALGGEAVTIVPASKVEASGIPTLNHSHVVGAPQGVGHRGTRAVVGFGRATVRIGALNSSGRPVAANLDFDRGLAEAARLALAASGNGDALAATLAQVVRKYKADELFVSDLEPHVVAAPEFQARLLELLDGFAIPVRVVKPGVPLVLRGAAAALNAAA